jgi:hypothetical protein
MAKKIDIEKEYLKLRKEANLTMEQEIAIEEKIQSYRIKSTKSLKEALDLATKASFQANLKEKKEASILSLQEKQNKSAGETYDISNRILDTSIKLLKGEENAFNISVDQAATKMKQLKTDKARLTKLKAAGNLTKDEAKQIKFALEDLQLQEGAYAKIMEAHTKGGEAMARNQLAFRSLNDKAEELGSTIDSTMKSIPLGGFLSKAFGLDDASAKIKKGIQEGFAKANAEIADGKKGMLGMRAGAAAFNAVLAINPLLLVVAAGTALFGILSDSEKKGRELANNTGMDLLRSQQLVDATAARQTKSDELLASSEDLLAVQQEVIATMGPMAQLSQEVASNIGETAAAFGYSAKTAGEAQASLMSMGATAEEAAKSQQDLAADAFKAGVNVGAVMDDVAKNSKKASEYMGGNIKEIQKAAIEAAKLGMNLGDLTGIADGLLDIESSLTSQFEFQAMTGKQLNLDKARELALAGDLAGMAREISKEAGNIDDFNKMNIVQRKSLAASMNMEVGQLQNMLAMDKVRENTSKELADQAAELGMNAEDLMGMNSEQLKKKIAETREGERMQKSMADMIESIKQSLLPAAEAFMGVIATVLEYVKIIITPITLFAGFVRQMAERFPIIASILKVIGGLMLANWLYAKYQARSQTKSVEKQIEAMEHQKKLNELKRWEAENAAKITSEEKKQTKEAKAQLDATKQQNKAAKQQSQPKSRLGKLGSKLGGSRIGKAMGLGQGGLLSKLGGGVKGLAGKAMGMMGGAGSMMGMIPGFATGGEVGSTGIAKVHAGEMITPASKVSGSERSASSEGGGGGGIDYEKMTKAFIAAMQQMPAPQVNMDGKKISDSVSETQSYDKGFV